MTLRKKSEKTFAPPSPYENIFEAVSPGRGGQIEVMISWHERILQTCHYPIGPVVTMGIKANINLPFGTLFRNFKLLESHYGQAFINLPIESKNYIQKNNDRVRLQAEAYQLNQNEVVFMTFSNDINLAIRFAPRTTSLSLHKRFFLTASETTAFLSAMIISFFSNLFFSVKSVKTKFVEEPVQRIVEVHFERPQKHIEPVFIPQPPIEIPVQPLVIEEPTLKIKPIKSKIVDVSKVGLMSILGSFGMKEKINLVNSGSTETIGMGKAATGETLAEGKITKQTWDEKLKQIGEGGLATPTVAIDQQKTNRSRYGKITSFGGDANAQKDQVKIQAGTGEENFIGTIDRDAVRRAVRSHLQSIKYCYEREYKKNTLLNGKVVVAWEINKEGFAQNARIIANQTTIDNCIVEDCVRSVIETIRFPQPPQDALVEVTGFPFVFSGLK